MITEFAKYRKQYTMESVLRLLGPGYVYSELKDKHIQPFVKLLKGYIRWKYNFKRISLERVLPGDCINPKQEHIHLDFMSDGNHNIDITDEEEFIEFINNPDMFKETNKFNL